MSCVAACSPVNKAKPRKPAVKPKRSTIFVQSAAIPYAPDTPREVAQAKASAY